MISVTTNQLYCCNMKAAIDNAWINEPIIGCVPITPYLQKWAVDSMSMSNHHSLTILVYITDLRLFIFSNTGTWCYKFPSKYCFRYIPQIVVCHIFTFIGTWRSFGHWQLIQSLLLSIITISMGSKLILTVLLLNECKPGMGTSTAAIEASVPSLL